MGRNAKPKAPKVFDYLYSLDLAWCYGPVDQLNRMWIKDKSVLCGAFRGRRNLCIDQPELFGGDDKEGGVVGVIEFYPGTPDQVSSAELARRANRTPATFPGYRNLCHTFFRGPMGRNRGFQWATNNPYLPATEANFTRIPRQLNSQHAAIFSQRSAQAGSQGNGDSWQVAFEPSGRRFRHVQGAIPTRVNAVSVNPNNTVVRPVVRGQTAFCDSGDERAGTTFTNFDTFSLGFDGLLRGQDTDVPPMDIDVDSGTVQMTVWISAFETSFGGGAQSVIQAYGWQGQQDPQTGEWVRVGPPTEIHYHALNVATGNQAGTRTWEHSRTFPIPAGIRFVGVSAIVNPGVLGTGGLTASEASLAWDEVDPVFCSVKEGGLSLLPDANPAHILYEVMINDDWGKGETPDMMDTASFEACAATLFNERFGLSLGWYRQSSVESFAQEILDHIKAFLFQNPETGLWQMRLLRNDYNRNTLPWLNPDNCTIINPKRRTWGETVNEIVVTYTDPETEEDATVVSHNLANIQIQGGINSEGRNYYGVRNERLAKQLADRDVIEAGTPLWSGVAEVDRSFWKTLPGDCFRLNWPEEGIQSMIVRVMSVERGTLTDRRIRLNLTEDIFGVDALTFVRTQISEAPTFDARPQPLDTVLALPAPLATVLRFDDSVGEDPDENSPDVAVMLFAAAPDEVQDVDVLGEIVNDLGETVVASRAVITPTSVTTLSSVLHDEPRTLDLPRQTVIDAGDGALAAGDLLLVGNSLDDHEIIQLVSFDRGLQFWTAERGIYDTVPRRWPVGTPIRAYPNSPDNFDLQPVDGTQPKAYWWLPRTGQGRLRASAAPRTDWPMRLRPYLPARPANCQINGRGTLPFEVEIGAVPPTLNLSWSRRNRFGDDATPSRWSAGDSAPEAGQTVTIRLTNAAGSVLFEETGLTGTSYVLPTAAITGDDIVVFVEFWAANADGTESLMAAKRPIVLSGHGWGFGYGEDWDSQNPPDPFEPDGAEASVVDLTTVTAEHVVSEGGLRLTQAAPTSTNRLRWVLGSDPIVSVNRPVYWEVQCVAGAAQFNGYLGAARREDWDRHQAANPIMGAAFGFRGNGSVWRGVETIEDFDNAQFLSGLPTFGAGSVVMFAFDPVLLGVWLGVNGQWVQNRRPGDTSPLFYMFSQYRGETFYPTLQVRGSNDSVRLRTRLQDFSFVPPAGAEPLMKP